MQRVPYWNISSGMLIDLLAIPALVIFSYGVYRQWWRISLGELKLRTGLKELFSGIRLDYVRRFFVAGIVNGRLYQHLFSGVCHGMLFWGMFLLFIGSLLVLLNVLTGVPVFRGGFNRWYMSFTLDLAGLIAITGILFLLGRRLLSPGRVSEPRERAGFVAVELWITVILITGFLVEGLRIAANGLEVGSFVGNCVGSLFAGVETKTSLHRVMWWVHGLMAIALVAYIPFSPLVHLVLSPINAAISDPQPGIHMQLTNFEGSETEHEVEPILGASCLGEYSKKTLLETTSCVWCGRCHEVCPATQTKKALSPKGVMVTFAEYLDKARFADKTLIDEIAEESVYNCTTCALCKEVCPVHVNQPMIILKMRQHLAMERAQMPEIMARAISSLEERHHPFYGTRYGKLDWSKGLDVPFFEKGKTEYLLWVGCFIAYEERAQKIARAMVGLLERAGVSYGILKDPRCTGDPARQMGNDFLFREIARENIQEFSQLGITKIITMCPHCFDTFVHYYPQLGGQYEVFPHVVLIDNLIVEGMLRAKKELRKITFHDPCYLARHNGVVDEPRRVLLNVGSLVEMPRNRQYSFCCGGGGGNYWAEEKGEKISLVRAREAMEVKSDVLATACPYCLLMLTDAMKNLTKSQIVYDIAELV